MNIQCPICAKSIEVDEAHVGQKGRCLSCKSKFIIPETPDGEFEILEEGTAEPAETRTKPVLAPRGRPVAAVRRVLLKSSRTKTGIPVGLLAICGVCVALPIYYYHTTAAKRGDGQPGPSASGGTGRPEISAPATTDEPPPGSGPEIIPAPTGEGTTASVATTGPATTDQSPTPTDQVPGEEPPAEEKVPELSEEKRERALAFMKSDQRSKREGAYAALRNLGDAYREIYADLLGKARGHHSSLIGNRAFDLSIGDNPLTGFQEAHDEWQGVLVKAKTMVQTDWKTKAPGDYRQKHAEMDEAFAEAARLRSRMQLAAERARRYDLGSLQAGLAVLSEIDNELAWCRDDEPESTPPLKDAVREAGGADGFVKILDLLDRAGRTAATRAAVAEHNRGCGWATGAYKTFAENLNDRRAALGLGPLRLDEKLSDACVRHSADMAANGYFSHTGLTDETRTFGLRARRAGFTGSPTGECIFMGNPSPDAAHQAWWYSDGHRRIMYADNPSTLGLGLSGRYWTLNTGRKNW